MDDYLIVSIACYLFIGVGLALRFMWEEGGVSPESDAAIGLVMALFWLPIALVALFLPLLGGDR